MAPVQLANSFTSTHCISATGAGFGVFCAAAIGTLLLVAFV
jgi:hypothetical protein